MLNNIHSPNFPKVPTLKEIGYNGPPSRGWYGLFAPAGTPRPIVDRIAKEVAAIVADPDFAQKQLKDRSLVGATSTPDAFASRDRRRPQSGGAGGQSRRHGGGLRWSFRDGRRPGPESITTAGEYGFRLRGLRPRAGMTTAVDNRDKAQASCREPS